MIYFDNYKHVVITGISFTMKQKSMTHNPTQNPLFHFNISTAFFFNSRKNSNTNILSKRKRGISTPLLPCFMIKKLSK